MTQNGNNRCPLIAPPTCPPEILRQFNELVPPGERSWLVERLIERALVGRRGKLEALAEEFATDPDFAAVRIDGAAFDVTVVDGLDD